MIYYERKNYKKEKFDNKDFNDNFIVEYKNYLEERLDKKNLKKMNLLYHDIDKYTKGKVVDYIFYENLCKFFNAQSELIFNNKINFSIDKYDKRLCLKYKDEEYLLKSDQFCFSAYDLVNKINKNRVSYPLVKYIKNSVNKKEAYEYIAKFIYYTRTIGCSFIWSINEQNKNSINSGRGVNSYIEDCVDLTLLEIKKFYNILEKDGNKNIIDKMKEDNNILLNYEDKNDIVKLLSIFKTFENYINFFAFNDFVKIDEDDIKIIDIVNSDLNKNHINYLNDNSKKQKRIKKINDIKELEKIFSNLCILITNRSNRIENVLKL